MLCARQPTRAQRLLQGPLLPLQAPLRLALTQTPLRLLEVVDLVAAATARERTSLREPYFCATWTPP